MTEMTPLAKKLRAAYDNSSHGDPQLQGARMTRGQMIQVLLLVYVGLPGRVAGDWLSNRIPNARRKGWL